MACAESEPDAATGDGIKNSSRLIYNARTTPADVKFRAPRSEMTCVADFKKHRTTQGVGEMSVLPSLHSSTGDVYVGMAAIFTVICIVVSALSSPVRISTSLINGSVGSTTRAKVVQIVGYRGAIPDLKYSMGAVRRDVHQLSVNLPPLVDVRTLVEDEARLPFAAGGVCVHGYGVRVVVDVSEVLEDGRTAIDRYSSHILHGVTRCRRLANAVAVRHKRSLVSKGGVEMNASEKSEHTVRVGTRREIV